MTPYPTVAPVSGVEQQSLLTDEQIKQVAREAVAARLLSWTGYEEDERGYYTVPTLSPCHYQFARAIERAAIAACLVQPSDSDLSEAALNLRALAKSGRELRDTGEYYKLCLHDVTELERVAQVLDNAASYLANQSQAAQPLYDDNGEPWNEAAEKAEEVHAALALAERLHGTTFADVTPGYYEAMSKVFKFARSMLDAAHLAVQSQAAPVAEAVPEGWSIERDDYPVGPIYTVRDSMGVRGVSQENEPVLFRFLEALLTNHTAQEVTQQAAKAETAEQANELMRKALEDIAQPADAGCGCSFPCRCNDDGAEAINAGILRGIASDTLAEVDRRFRAQGGNTNDKGSDLAPTTSTVSASDDRDTLAFAITRAAERRGIIGANTPLTGPQLVMLCDALATPTSTVSAPERWISVDDELPEVETDVLVRGKRGDSVCHAVAGLFYGLWQGQGSESDLRFTVTHWMPLPEEPRTTPNKGEAA